MGMKIRQTQRFEYPGVEVDISKLDLEANKFDPRLCMSVPQTEIKRDLRGLYRNYVHAFCTMINLDRTCRPAYMTACGFLPIGIEPIFYSGIINKEVIIPALQKLDVDYFLLPPMSPVKSAYEQDSNATLTHDVWVNKLDAQKLVHKPPHNITALDVLEAIGI